MGDDLGYDMVAEGKKSEYDQVMPQSHTPDKPVAPRGGVDSHLVGLFRPG